MIHGGRRAFALLFLGDIATFIAALWLTLFVRYAEFPNGPFFLVHLLPFSALFLIWTLVFYMAGLYGKRTILFKSHLPQTILRTQFFNIVLAALFFFLAPGIGVTPKASLLIYLVISLLLIFLWRLVLYPRLSIPRVRMPAVLIASGSEAQHLVSEVNGNARYQIEFKKVYEPSELAASTPQARRETLISTRFSMLVVDGDDSRVQELLPELYALPGMREGSTYIQFADLYEDVFDRIPLSLLHQGWFLQNVSATTPLLYAIAKRIIDIVGGLLMFLIMLIVLPFVWLAMRLEDTGPLFITQQRIGERGSRIRTYKFRSMRESDAGVWAGESTNQVTRVGAFLRLTSLDEFPQCLNVLKGELSLIGPRNDLEALGLRLAEALPFYNFRYLVRPGITGWAQINQQYEQGHISPQSIEETKVRLAYDFYYIKNRSLGLDIVIALKTIKRMFFRVSSW